METGKAYPIGDRNWAAWDVSHDIPHLAVRKVDDTPTFEFGILRGFAFEKEDITKIEVYGTEIKKFNPQSFFSSFWSFIYMVLILLPVFFFCLFGRVSVI
jgi:hypothetical protein